MGLKINIGVRAHTRKDKLYKNLGSASAIVQVDLVDYAMLLFDVTVPQPTHVTVMADLLTYDTALFDARVPDPLHVTATADLLTYSITDYSATAIQVKDVSSTADLSTYTVGQLDPTITTQVLQLPNLVPSADVSVGDWTTAPLWSKVNVPGSSTSFISSSNANGSTCRLRFTSPVASTPAVLRLFRRKSGGTSNPDFIWTLYRDGVQIQTNTLTITSTTFVQTDYPLTENLVAGAVYEITLTRSGGGGPSARGVVDMAALWIDPV